MYVHQAMHFLLIDELLHIVKHFLGFFQLGVQGHTNQKKTIIHNEVRYLNCRSVTISITTYIE